MKQTKHVVVLVLVPRALVLFNLMKENAPGGRDPPLRPTILGTIVDSLKQAKHVVVLVLVLVPRALVLFYLKMKENARRGPRPTLKTEHSGTTVD